MFSTVHQYAGPALLGLGLTVYAALMLAGLAGHLPPHPWSLALALSAAFAATGLALIYLRAAAAQAEEERA